MLNWYVANSSRIEMQRRENFFFFFPGKRCLVDVTRAHRIIIRVFATGSGKQPDAVSHRWHNRNF